MTKIQEFAEDLMYDIKESDWIDVIKMAFLFSFIFLCGAALTVFCGFVLIVLPWYIHPLLGLFMMSGLAVPFVFVISVKCFWRKGRDNAGNK